LTQRTAGTNYTKGQKEEGQMPKPDAENGEQDDFIEWLREKEFSDECIESFIEAGYEGTEVGDVEDKDVDKVLKAKPGLAKKVKLALADWRAEHAEPESPEMPDLPEGKEFDLSLPEIEISEDVTFKIPDALSVRASKAAVLSPMELKKKDWIVIAKNSNLLKGFDMSGEEPKRAKTSVLWWKVPKKTDFVAAEHLKAESDSSLAYSENTAKYVSHGFDTETASAGFEYAAASFERNHEERSAGASMKRKLFMRAMWDYPRATVYLRKCSVVSPDFKDSVEKALKSADAATELGKVLKEYGHAVAMEVLVGGQLYFEQEEESSGELTDNEMKEVYKAAAEIKYQGVKAGAGAGVGNAKKKQDAAHMKAASVSFKCNGGDTTQVSNPAAWAPSVKDPKTWAVIARSDVIPTYELLDSELKEKVLKVWEKIPPFFGTVQDLAWKENGGGKESTTTSAFLIAVRQVPPEQDGARGSVLVVSGPGGDPKEGNPGTAAGAAFAHMYRAGDIWYDCNGVCIPVRAAYRYGFNATCQKPGGRLAFIPSKLPLGDWVAVDISEEFSAPGDGFLFASIDTQEQDGYGDLYAVVDQRRAAGCSAHRNHASDEWIDRGSFCIPIAGGSKVKFETNLIPQSPAFELYWAPVAGKNAKMQNMETRTLNTHFEASTDGVLFGCISAGQPGRATLRLYSYPKKGQPNYSNPIAAASIHYNQVGKPRLVKASSAMLPVRQGTCYEARYENIAGSPTADLFWMPVVKT
jgi:MAC/Perforin domain